MNLTPEAIRSVAACVGNKNAAMILHQYADEREKSLSVADQRGAGVDAQNSATPSDPIALARGLFGGLGHLVIFAENGDIFPLDQRKQRALASLETAFENVRVALTTSTPNEGSQRGSASIGGALSGGALSGPEVVSGSIYGQAAFVGDPMRLEDVVAHNRKVQEQRLTLR